jgi:aryl-alcohol dehydrogenase-like predicted oxidoreductase
MMADLMKEGKILHWDISQVDADYLRRAHAVCPVTAVENRYSMIARNCESLLPVLEELGVSLVAFSPLANGPLSGEYGKGMKFDKTTDCRSAMPSSPMRRWTRTRSSWTSSARSPNATAQPMPRSPWPG